MYSCGNLGGSELFVGEDVLLDEQVVEALFEVLVRRAVVAARQRLALARSALAGVRTALARSAVDLEQLRRGLQQFETKGDVGVDHVPYEQLVVHREVRAHFVEERTRGTGEVAPVG